MKRPSRLSALRSPPTHPSRRRVSHRRPRSMPQKARQTVRRAPWFFSALIVGFLCALTSSTEAWALGLGGRGLPLSPPRLIADGGAERLELGLYVTTLLGFESNYLVTTSRVDAAAVWALEGGAELRWHLTDAWRLRLEFSGMLRLPFAAPSFENPATADLPKSEQPTLVESLVELPVLLTYTGRTRWTFSLFSHIAYERSKTPPVFFDAVPNEQLQGTQGKSGVGGNTALAGSGRTIVYQSAYAQLRPAISAYVVQQLMVEGGLYLRGKLLDFQQNPFGSDPDYGLFDLGFDLSATGRPWSWLTLRTKYDFAVRVFDGFQARPSQYEPAKDEDLQMYRHILALSASVRVLRSLQLRGRYLYRHNTDNGGFFDYSDHLLEVGVAFTWYDDNEVERFSFAAHISYLSRGYRHRTLCEAMQVPGQTGYQGTDCRPIGPSRLEPSAQPQKESALVLSASATYALTEWLQLVATYELEDADSDIEDLLVSNHRVMAGVSMQY